MRRDLQRTRFCPVPVRPIIRPKTQLTSSLKMVLPSPLDVLPGTPWIQFIPRCHRIQFLRLPQTLFPVILSWVRFVLQNPWTHRLSPRFFMTWFTCFPSHSASRSRSCYHTTCGASPGGNVSRRIGPQGLSTEGASVGGGTYSCSYACYLILTRLSFVGLCELLRSWVCLLCPNLHFCNSWMLQRFRKKFRCQRGRVVYSFFLRSSFLT